MVKHAARDFATGLEGYWRGVKWLLARPSMLLALTIPWILAIAAFGAGMWAFWTMGSGWLTTVMMGWFASWNDHWAWELAYVLVKGLMWFSVLLMCLVTSAVVLGLAASPVYEFISLRIERDLLGEQHFKVSWRRIPRLLMGEVIKAAVVTLVPLCLLLIPGVNLFAGLCAAFLLGWDFYDYPLARRGWSLSERWRFVRSEFWTVLGFGIWLSIPVVQIVLVPMAVAGGTILNIEALKRRGHVTASLNQGGIP